MSFSGPIREIIAGEGLVLKLLSEASAPALFRVINENRNVLRKWLPFVDNTWKINDTEIFIRSVLLSSGPKPDIVYEIWYQDNFAGLIALKEVDRFNKRTELGYWLNPEVQGKGIMTTCCRCLIDFAFKKLKMHRLQIKVGIGNAPSARIPEKLGFRFEGIERNGEKFSDHYIDIEVYSMLREEWTD